ncbi:hypothetical protein PGB90_006333 [Kerria lacca]
MGEKRPNPAVLSLNGLSLRELTGLRQRSVSTTIEGNCKVDLLYFSFLFGRSSAALTLCFRTVASEDNLLKLFKF